MAISVIDDDTQSRVYCPFLLVNCHCSADRQPQQVFGNES